jgi:hypothetical protein
LERQLNIGAEERQARIKRWERIGPRLIKADLESGRLGLVGPDWQEIAWQWLRQKDAEREIAATEPSPRQHLAQEIRQSYREMMRRARTMLTRFKQRAR